MPTPLISIITPCFNPGPKLASTIESVISQKSDLYEYLVIDGGSAHDTLRLLTRHEERVGWLSEQDKGPYDAMNKGVAHTRGRYLYFLGAGDRLRPGVLEKIAPSLPAEGASFVYGNVDMGGRKYNGQWTASRFRRGQNICQQSIFYSREIFDKLGPFDLRYPVLSDHAFNMRCWGDPSISKVYLDEIIADYEGGGLSDKQTDKQLMRDYPKMVRRDLGAWQYFVYQTTRMFPRSVRRLARKTLRR